MQQTTTSTLLTRSNLGTCCSGVWTETPQATDCAGSVRRMQPVSAQLATSTVTCEQKQASRGKDTNEPLECQELYPSP